VNPFKTTTLAGAVLVALSSGAGAHAAEPSREIKALKGTVEALRQQVQELKRNQRSDADALDKARLDELRKQVEELRAQLKKPAEAQAVTGTTTTEEGESQEAIEARTPASKADIQGLRTDLENYKYDQQRLQERNIPSVTRNTKIGGSVTVGFQTQNPAAAAGNQSTTPGEPRKNGFTAASATLNFAGNLYRDYAEGRNLTYRVAFATGTNLNAKNTYSTEFGKNNADGSQFNLTDAYIRYSYQPQSGNAEDPLGTITIGQQAIPFGQDPQALDPEVRPVINSAQFSSALGLGTRQIGLVVSGDYEPYVDYTNNYRAPLVGYSLGLVNGNGPNKVDNNSLRDWVGRLVYTLPVDYSSWLRQLQIGTSYYRGYGFQPGATLTTQGKGTYTRNGFDVNWTHLPFSISYEWAYGKDELPAATASNPDGFKRGVGQYINLGYTWGEQFLNSSKQQGKFDDFWPLSYQAFLRFDSWDPDRNVRVQDDHKYVTTLGLNVFFAETTKFQINYLHTRNQTGAPSSAAKPRSSNGVQAQLSATF